MANFSIRMLSGFLFAAFLLNVSNYLFIRVYDQSYQNQQKYNYQKTGSALDLRRSLNPKYWSLAVECDNKDKASSVSSTQRANDYSELESNNYSTNYLLSEKTNATTEKEIDDCPELPSGLGPELEDRSVLTNNLYNFEAKSSDVKPGGVYHPTNCKSLQSVAIIIAYRGCKNYLLTFMNLLHPFLIKQQLDYQIFVVEQSNKTQPYNRGKLLNVGFTEAMRYRRDGFRCIILHEPHIVPMDSRNLYRCSSYPRQLATSVERPIKASYVPLHGGAIAITPQQFLKFNGFSNLYWGNDADYYDLYYRINATNYYIENSFPLVGKFKTIRKGLALWNKSEYMSSPSPLYLLDGLTSLTYTVDNFDLRRLYTYLQVNIDPVVETKIKDKMYDNLLNSVTYKTSPQLIKHE